MTTRCLDMSKAGPNLQELFRRMQADGLTENYAEGLLIFLANSIILQQEYRGPAHKELRDSCVMLIGLVCNQAGWPVEKFVADAAKYQELWRERARAVSAEEVKQTEPGFIVLGQVGHA